MQYCSCSMNIQDSVNLFFASLPRPSTARMSRAVAAVSRGDYGLPGFSGSSRDDYIFPRAVREQASTTERLVDPKSYAYNFHAFEKQKWTPYGQEEVVKGVDTVPVPPYVTLVPPEIVPQEESSMPVKITPVEVLPFKTTVPVEVLPFEPRPARSTTHRKRPSNRRPDVATLPEDLQFDMDLPTLEPEEPQWVPRRLNSHTRRLGRSIYDAVQTHGQFGLVDGGESAQGIRKVILHVPKRSKGFVLDLRPGDVIHANSGRGGQVSGALVVSFVSRHKYVSPGHAVTSCVIGVPEEQWKRFVE